MVTVVTVVTVVTAVALSGAGAAGSRRLQATAVTVVAGSVVAHTVKCITLSGTPAAVAGMLTHIIKLTLKTLVEEARFCTFGREGFQQLHLDCGMLRWVLPTCVEDEGAVLSLLDELLISCQVCTSSTTSPRPPHHPTTPTTTLPRPPPPCHPAFLLSSPQERCLECVPLEHSVLERLCDAKRKELLLALA